jgi:tripartite-type tricarboxylate transporter receptor subunit TctC
LATEIGRRRFIKVLGTTFGAAAATSIAAPNVARAQGAYPNRQVRIVVPAPPAGITDLSARLVADGLRAKFNQPFVVENKSGGNGFIGLREMVRAAPDGYTLMVGTVGTTVINFAIDSAAGDQLMMGTPPKPFDPARDMVPIAGTAEYATAMVVNKNMPVKTVADFIAYAKERPGKLTFGSTGVGALDFVAAELFMKAAGIKMVHVPYRGGPAALNDLMGGSIDTIIESIRWSWSRSGPG